MLFRDILLIDEHYHVQPHANILVEGDKITAITQEVPQGYHGDVFDGRGKLAAPGFFNAHCHVPMTLLRGYGENLPLQRWLAERVFPFEGLLSGEDAYWGALLGIAEMLASGTASFTDMYFLMPNIAEAVLESGIKANLGYGAVSGGPGEHHFADTPAYNDTLSLLEFAKAAPAGRLRADVALHAEYTCDALLAREAAEFAGAQKLRMHLHLSETQREHEEAKQRRGMTAARWFETLGVFEQPVTAAHCVWVEPQDMQLLAQHGATAAHCPSSNLKLGSGIAPLAALQQAGVRVAIGTDGAASNNNLNMLEETTLAGLLHKGAMHDAEFLPAPALMEAACKAGALAQGRTDCGAIAPGNRADIVVYNLDSPAMLPLINPLANLLYAGQSADVVLNMVDGRVLYRNGEFLTIDMEKVRYKVQRIVDAKLRILGTLPQQT